MRKTLTKSPTNVVMTGTLGGIAEFIGIDATIIRVLYVFLSLVTTGFPGVLLYIVLALVIPSAKGGHRSNPGNPYRSGSKGSYKQFRQQPPKEAEKIDDDDWSDF
ncbi:PspC domain-containing protein [Enterococcus asini]|uniref:PspC domain-containing protein n=1 Tax=Enterococcus TaxID=1350 RepID=UPI00288F4BA7|nr:PspC domain-containing protein [Enterococcus asini]MDT2756483.1 PspC domain-containing protein [Enterococcus asini]